MIVASVLPAVATTLMGAPGTLAEKSPGGVAIVARGGKVVNVRTGGVRTPNTLIAEPDGASNSIVPRRLADCGNCVAITNAACPLPASEIEPVPSVVPASSRTTAGIAIADDEALLRAMPVAIEAVLSNATK